MFTGSRPAMPVATASRRLARAAGWVAIVYAVPMIVLAISRMTGPFWSWTIWSSRLDCAQSLTWVAHPFITLACGLIVLGRPSALAGCCAAFAAVTVASAALSMAESRSPSSTALPRSAEVQTVYLIYGGVSRPIGPPPNKAFLLTTEFLAVAAASIVAVVAACRLARLRDDRRCADCDASLLGIATVRCPECGRECIV